MKQHPHLVALLQNTVLSADKAAVAQEIRAWVAALMSKPAAMLRQRAILQLACAAVHALHGAGAAEWDALHKREQQLMAASTSGTALRLE